MWRGPLLTPALFCKNFGYQDIGGFLKEWSQIVYIMIVRDGSESGTDLGGSSPVFE